VPLDKLGAAPFDKRSAGAERVVRRVDQHRPGGIEQLGGFDKLTASAFGKLRHIAEAERGGRRIDGLRRNAVRRREVFPERRLQREDVRLGDRRLGREGELVFGRQRRRLQRQIGKLGIARRCEIDRLGCKRRLRRRLFRRIEGE
jgi:hypothetical protein